MPRAPAQRRLTRHECSRLTSYASPGGQSTPRQPDFWDLVVDGLDLDQFDDEGNLIAGYYVFPDDDPVVEGGAP